MHDPQRSEATSESIAQWGQRNRALVQARAEKARPEMEPVAEATPAKVEPYRVRQPRALPRFDWTLEQEVHLLPAIDLPR